jgi:hypothetical protein
MAFNERPQRDTRAIYLAEGSIHLYSSDPVALTPAELYQAKHHPTVRNLLNDCNIYVIATRPRILIDPEEVSVERGSVNGYFIVQRPSGVVRVSFVWRLPLSCSAITVDEISVTPAGTHINLELSFGRFQIPAHDVVAHAQSALQNDDKDLDVLYVGQGIGRSRRRSALDRLVSHTTLQRILAEMTTFYPHSEILLLLFRFEHRKTLISTGGDLTVEPLASSAEERAHLDRMGKVSLSRHEQISLAEAALIRYFQPWFNVQIKNSDFSGKQKIKVLDRLLKKDLTGLIVEICSSNINSRLKTAQRPPRELSDLFPPDVLNGSRLETDEDEAEWQRQLHAMAHTHYAQFPLTTPEERDTFMHGVRWHGQEERQDFMGSTGSKKGP